MGSSQDFPYNCHLSGCKSVASSVRGEEDEAVLESRYKQSGHAIREAIRHRCLRFQDKITITIAIRESTNLLCTKKEMMQEN